MVEKDARERIRSMSLVRDVLTAVKDLAVTLFCVFLFRTKGRFIHVRQAQATVVSGSSGSSDSNGVIFLFISQQRA